MSSSIITKQALAESLKELMKEKNFSKISIGEICENCHLNRKTFYYHFMDKFELVNWIFLSEFISQIKNNEIEDFKAFIKVSCTYFYENRNFYKSALEISGQNSFPDFFAEYLKPFILSIINEKIIETKHKDFLAEILTDSTINTIRKWLQNKTESIPLDEFIEIIISFVDSF